MSDEEGMSLVMPFVVCRSEGGPFDDESFVAGWDAALLWVQLQAGGPQVIDETARALLVPQLDLIAMKFGYSFAASPCDCMDGQFADDWSHVHMERQP